MHILVAEDDVGSRMILAAVLRRHGFDPVVVGDGIDAWQIMKRKDAPNLALLDWEMPGMDGLEVCQKIRERPKLNPPYIMILTGRGEKGDIVRGLDAGANDYLLKPYDTGELLARIRVGQRMVQLQADLIEAKDALAYEAMHDSLTGLLNRRAILDCLSKELVRAQRRGTSLSIGLCDLDHFKRINDTYGHQAGDEALCGFARITRDNLREYDHVGRYGGEEFLVVAPDSSGSPQENLYERLRASVAAFPLKAKAGKISLTVSIGVVGVKSPVTVDDLLTIADGALYAAKEQGRNRIVYG